MNFKVIFLKRKLQYLTQSCLSKRRLPIDALKNVVDLEIVLKYHILINNFKTGIFFFQNPMNNQYSTIVVRKIQDNV